MTSRHRQRGNLCSICGQKGKERPKKKFTSSVTFATDAASASVVVLAFSMHHSGFRPEYLGNTTTFTQPPGVTPQRHSPRVPTSNRSGSRAPHTAPSLSPGSLTPRTPVVLSPRVRQWAPRTARGETWSSRHQPFHGNCRSLRCSL